MAEREVKRGEDAPVETADANPGEKRNTGQTGPSPEPAEEGLDADPDSVRLASDVAAERLAATPKKTRRRSGRGRTETR